MKAPFKAKVGLKGFYKLDIHNDKGELKKSYEFENLITDNGLDLLATTSTFPIYCSVGSGSATPTESDTSLDLFVASRQGSYSSGTTGQYFNSFSSGGSPDYELICRGVYAFGEGVAQGNLSEIGIGPAADGTNLFSRALIRDTNGDTTTITVLSNEFLTVTYYLHVYPPLTDVTGSVDGHSYILRARRVSFVSNTRAWDFAYNNVQGWSKSTFNLTGGGAQAAYTGGIGSITGAPTGTTSTTTTRTTNPYVPGSYTRSGSFKFNINQANFNIKSLGFDFGVGSFQIELDPVIPKKNTDELTIFVSVSWGRL